MQKFSSLFENSNFITDSKYCLLKCQTHFIFEKISIKCSNMNTHICTAVFLFNKSSIPCKIFRSQLNYIRTLLKTTIALSVWGKCCMWTYHFITQNIFKMCPQWLQSNKINVFTSSSKFFSNTLKKFFEVYNDKDILESSAFFCWCTVDQQF